MDRSDLVDRANKYRSGDQDGPAVVSLKPAVRQPQGGVARGGRVTGRAPGAEQTGTAGEGGEDGGIRGAKRKEVGDACSKRIKRIEWP